MSDKEFLLDDEDYCEKETFHVQLKNGHYFDYPLRYIQVKYEGNHIIVFLDMKPCTFKFYGAFDLSEVAYACAQRMYLDYRTMTLSDKPPITETEKTQPKRYNRNNPSTATPTERI